MLLFNPGPVSITERVRRSLLRPDLCHREPEFFDLQDKAHTHLLGIYDADPSVWSPVLLSGSGTAAVESMVASLVPKHGKILILENGAFGQRIAQIAGHYNIAHEVVRHHWLESLDLLRIAERLEENREFSHVALVHHETSTGRLNNIAAISNLCRQFGVRLLVDCVSSFGAEHIDFSDENIDAVAASSNKCVQGVPGVSFVIVRKEALSQASSRTFYLDLVQAALLQGQRNTRFTPAVHACYALVEALVELKEEGGWRARHHRYAACSGRLHAGLASNRIYSAIPPDESSVAMNAYYVPPHMPFAHLHDFLKARGFLIYNTAIPQLEPLFRVAVMGKIRFPDVNRLLLAFDELMLTQEVEAGACNGSAQT